MTGGFYIWCILYSYEREITLNPEYWVCGGGRGWWLVVVMVVVVDISRYFPIETDWCPSQHFHHQTSQHPPRHPANLAMLDSSVSIYSSPQFWRISSKLITSNFQILSCSDHSRSSFLSPLSLLCPALRTGEKTGGREGWVPANILP